MNLQQSFLMRGVFGGLFLGTGILVTMIGGIFSRIRTAVPMTGYVYELIAVGVISLIIGIGILAWSWSRSKSTPQ
ncbi:MAG TPA: hypothetical protein VKF15_01030 [Nitrososphaerales archaeon]|nr:hypothetical protein [Nitrososphaerales archaeon]